VPTFVQDLSRLLFCVRDGKSPFINCLRINQQVQGAQCANNLYSFHPSTTQTHTLIRQYTRHTLIHSYVNAHDTHTLIHPYVNTHQYTRHTHSHTHTSITRHTHLDTHPRAHTQSTDTHDEDFSPDKQQAINWPRASAVYGLI
jgi:hypothetical protein